LNFEDVAYAFVRELQTFAYRLSSIDHVWDLLFPDKNEKWNHLNVNKTQKTFYISHVNGDAEYLEIQPGKSVTTLDPMAFRPYGDYYDQTGKWEPLIASARKWLRAVKRDWIKANKHVQGEYPLKYRYGIAPNSLIRASLPDLYRLDKELGKANTRKIVRLVEDGFFMNPDNTECPSMTAANYYGYCKIAYISGKRKDDDIDESLSGREMYIRYADGRHEGLLDIDENSEQEFADWIDGKHRYRSLGGHPFEIKRGGNTTHIDLNVSRPSLYKKEGFKVELRGESIGRMVETMKMFLAIQDAKLPINIANPESVRKRLLAQDYIGIVPSYDSLHRANQRFREDQDVFDVMYYDDLGRYKRRITPFITWEPLPILRPKDP
jgi:hypothetical protein